MNIKLVFHLADLHIKNYNGHDQYRKIFSEMVGRFKELASPYQSEEVRIVIAGDFFHQKISVSNEQTLFAAWLMNKLSKIGKVVIIPGNHDFLENNHLRLDSITPVVNLIENHNVVYYRESGVYLDNNVQWVIYSMYNHNERPSFINTGDKKYIGIFHGQVNGCKNHTGYEFEDGYDTHIFKGCDIVLAGDIHDHQIVEYDDNGKKIRVIQAGSLVQQNFGETIKNHGFGLYILETDEYIFEELKNNSPYLKFRITDIEDIKNGTEQLLNLE